jgi:hypothetical protein
MFGERKRVGTLQGAKDVVIFEANSSQKSDRNGSSAERKRKEIPNTNETFGKVAKHVNETSEREEKKRFVLQIEITQRRKDGTK